MKKQNLNKKDKRKVFNRKRWTWTKRM